jgi:hypothetical protein
MGELRPAGIRQTHLEMNKKLQRRGRGGFAVDAEHPVPLRPLRILGVLCGKAFYCFSILED